MSKNILEIKNLSIMFGGIVALDDVNMTTKKGTIHGLIGPNGAGKTTLFNIMTGIYKPTSGNVYLNEKEITGFTPNKIANLGIARTFQNIALFHGMTTVENVMTGRQLMMKKNFFWQMLRVGPALEEEVEHRRKCEEIIDFLEIQAIRKTPVGSLPYGLQKRVELARALAMEPKLLLLDEPMAGMNVEEKEDMSRFILDVNEQYGTTIALIEHDMSVVMDLADRVVVLDYGKLLADGTPDEVQRNQAVIDAYLGVEH